MAIFAKCTLCGDHIISYYDEMQDVKDVNGVVTRKMMDVWVHDLYDSDPEPEHDAVPKTGSDNW